MELIFQGDAINMHVHMDFEFKTQVVYAMQYRDVECF